MVEGGTAHLASRLSLGYAFQGVGLRFRVQGRG